MGRSQSPDTTPSAASSIKRFCGLLDIRTNIRTNPATDVEQPLSPPTPGGTTSKVVRQAAGTQHSDDDQEQLLQQHDESLKDGESSRWPCSPAALSRKLASCRNRRCLILLQLLAVLAVVLIIAWPWILPGLMWRRSNTNWVVPGPEVDPSTYQVCTLYQHGHALCMKALCWNGESVMACEGFQQSQLFG